MHPFLIEFWCKSILFITVNDVNSEKMYDFS